MGLPPAWACSPTWSAPPEHVDPFELASALKSRTASTIEARCQADVAQVDLRTIGHPELCDLRPVQAGDVLLYLTGVEDTGRRARPTALANARVEQREQHGQRVGRRPPTRVDDLRAASECGSRPCRRCAPSE